MPPALLLIAALAVAPPDNPVLAAARKRQEAIRSVEFVLKVTEVTEPGGASTTPSVRLKPLERTTVTWTAHVLFDGDRSRVEDDRVPDSAGGAWRQIHACDGNLVRWLQWPPGRESLQYHSGGIYAAADRHEWPAPELTPPFLTCRSISVPGWDRWVDFGESVSSGDVVEVDGVSCQQWFTGDPPNRQQTRCWVDPAAGNVVRRFRLERTIRSDFVDLVIHYAKHKATGVWLPSEWECKKIGGNETLRKTYRVTVDKLTVNATWPDDEFDLAFPPDLRVHDHRDNTDYFVQPDGSLGKYRRDEDPANTLPTPPPVSWFAQYGPWVLAAVLILLVVGWLVARRVWRKAAGGRRERAG